MSHFHLNPFFYPPNTPIVVGSALSAQAQAVVALDPNPRLSADFSAQARSAMVMSMAIRADGALQGLASAAMEMVAEDAPKSLSVVAGAVMNMAGASIARSGFAASGSALTALTGYGITYGVLAAAASASAVFLPAAAKLLCHFNGSGSSYSDEVSGITWSEPADTTPAQAAGAAKFGAAGLNMPGQGVGENQRVRGSGFSSPHAGDFTIEVFARGDDPGLAYVAVLLSDSSGNVAVEIHLYASGGTKRVEANYYDSSGVQILNQFANLDYSSFQHIAVVRDGTNNTYALFAGGSRLDIDTVATDVRSFTRVEFVHDGDSLGAALAFDEVRLTDAIQYSGATYTVPTTEFS